MARRTREMQMDRTWSLSPPMEEANVDVAFGSDRLKKNQHDTMESDNRHIIERRS